MSSKKSFSVMYQKEIGNLIMTSDSISFVSSSSTSKTTSNKNKFTLRYTNIRKHFLNRKKFAVKIDRFEGSSVVLYIMGEDKGASFAMVSDEMVRRLKEVKDNNMSNSDNRKRRKRRKGEEKMLSAIRDEEKAEERERKRVRTQKDSKISRRSRLLESDKNLRQQYRDLVETKLVTEDEFWSNVPEDRFREMDRVTTLELDVPTIRDIFEKHPELLEIYQRNVPLKMSEEEFWKRYAISKAFEMNGSSDREDDDEEEKNDDDDGNVLDIVNRSSAKHVSMKETIPQTSNATTTTTSTSTMMTSRKIDLSNSSISSAVASTSLKTSTISTITKTSTTPSKNLPFSFDHNFVFGCSSISPRVLTSILSSTPIVPNNKISTTEEMENLRNNQRTLSQQLRHLYGTRSVLKRDRILSELVRLRRSLLQQRTFWTDASMYSIVHQIDQMLKQIDAACSSS